MVNREPGDTGQERHRAGLSADLADAARYRRAIVRYAWADIRIRFDRTLLGPFWIIVTSMLWIGSVGVVMAQLFNQPIAEQLPYLAYGVFAWSFLSAVLMEAASTFTGYKAFLLAYKVPLSFFVFRVAVRNLIVLGMLTFVGLLIAGPFGLLRIELILQLPLIVLLYAAVMVPLIIIIASVGARFLDLAPLIVVLTNMLVLVTPIFWQKTLLDPGNPIILLNPIGHLIDLYRGTFLYGGAEPRTILACIVIAIVLWAIAALTFRVAAPRVRNWL